MASRTLDSGIWQAPWFQDLTANEKLLYIYLGRNDHASACGIYTITPKTLAHELDLPSSQVEKALRSLEPHVLYDWRISMVFVRRFVEEQNNGSKWLISVGRALNALKPHMFVKEFLQENQTLNIAYLKGMDSLSIPPDTDTGTDIAFDLFKNKGVDSISEDQQPYEPAELGDPYEDAFATLWEMYPRKNGKLIGKADTEIEFRKVKPEDIPLVLAAVKHYAQSKRAQEGWGIRDPRYFFRKHGESTPYWREWIEPEKQEVNSGQRLKEPGYDEIPEK